MRPKAKTLLSTRQWAITGSSFMLAGAALLMATPAAYADSRANIEGARATFESSSGVFRLYDTKCDSHPVFLDYTINGKRHRIDYSGGCNNHGTYDTLNLPKGKRITYKACVNINNGFDKCSGEADDVT